MNASSCKTSYLAIEIAGAIVELSRGEIDFLGLVILARRAISKALF